MKKQILTTLVIGLIGLTQTMAQDVELGINNLKGRGFRKNIEKANIENFNKVNKLYNADLVAFYSLSSSEKVGFQVATNQILEGLENLKSKKAAKAAKELVEKQAIFGFIWNSQVKLTDPIFEEVQTAGSEVFIGLE